MQPSSRPSAPLVRSTLLPMGVRIAFLMERNATGPVRIQVHDKAQERGGSLTVHGDGPSRGATFTLELSLSPVQELA